MSCLLIAYPTTEANELLSRFEARAYADGANVVGSKYCTLQSIADILNIQLGYQVDTTDDIDIALTYSVQDIQDPTKRRGTFSKTVTIPNTPNNAKLFGHAYDLQSFFGGFNPAKKINVSLWEDGMQVFKGIMQLTGVKKQNETISYDVILYSEEVNIFRDIDGKLLTDLDFSDLDHLWTSDNVSGTWQAPVGSGYVYPMMDCGDYFDRVPVGGAFSGLLVNSFGVQNFRPAIYLKEYVDRIFSDAGKRYQSNFIDSTLFKRLAIPYPASGTPMYSFTQASGNTFRVGTTASQNPGIIEFNDDSTAGFYDPSSLFDTDAFAFLPQFDGVFRYSFRFTGTFTNTHHTNEEIAVGIQPGDTPTRSIVWRGVVPASGSLNVDFIFTYPIDRSVYPEIRMFYIDGGNVDLEAGATWQWIAPITMQTGDVMEMNNAVPPKIKQSELLQDLIKMFNLMFYPDPLDPDLIYIEPWVDFYASGSVNWDAKVDRYSEYQINTGDPEGVKQYIFSHANSGDFLGKNYQEQYQSTYGSRKYNVDNYYARNTIEISTLAAPCIPAQYVSERVIFRAFDFGSNGEAQPIITGYRIGQYNYVNPPSGTTWLFASSGTVITSGYPYIGHVDNPFNPQFDLLFGTPQQLYYNAFNASGFTNYTTNNLFNKYWKSYVDELVSPEAMQVELSVILDPTDIAKLDFRKPILINNILWRLIEIRDYVAGRKVPCRVTLRRILFDIPFQGAQRIIRPGYSPGGDENGDVFPILNPQIPIIDP